MDYSVIPLGWAALDKRIAGLWRGMRAWCDLSLELAMLFEFVKRP